MTTEHTSIEAALAAFQAEMPTVNKSKTARVPTKSGRDYAYSYADIADVTQEVMPLLSRHGLSFSCLPRQTPSGGYEIVGTLLHASGGRLEGSLPLFGTEPQKIGASITYARRYLIGCLTGVVTDDDDDARSTAGVTQQTRVVPDGEKMTDVQLAALSEWASQVNLPQFISETLGRPATSADMTAVEAETVLAKLAG